MKKLRTQKSHANVFRLGVIGSECTACENGLVGVTDEYFR